MCLPAASGPVRGVVSGDMAAAAEEGVPPEIEPPANTWGADLINAAAADTAAASIQQKGLMIYD